ncbi:hypothetical protein LCGC14_2474650, partial [marine sediment metagenome]
MTTDKTITLNYVNPFFGTTVPEDCDEKRAKTLQTLIDHGEIIKFNAVSDIGALFPNAAFAVVPIPTSNSSENDFESGKKLSDAKKEFTLIFKALTKGLDKEAKIAIAQANVDEVLSRIKDAMERQDLDAIVTLSDERSLALAELEKTKKGKTSNGDRSNPLPPFESTNAIMRGKNGGKVLALRGDAIPDYEAHGLPAENWQAFVADNGNYRWNGPLGQ